jgi:hypothetical protein
MHLTTVAGPAGRLNLTDTGAVSGEEPQAIPVLLAKQTGIPTLYRFD